MGDSEGFLTFRNRIRHLATAFSGMGLVVDERKMSMAVLNGWPDRFDNLICALDAVGSDRDAFTIDFVEIGILFYFIILLIFTTFLPPCCFVLLRFGFEGSSTLRVLPYRSDHPVRHLKCDHCGRTGHLSTKCFKKHLYLAPAGWGFRKPCDVASSGTGHVHTSPRYNYVCLLSTTPACTSASTGLWTPAGPPI